MDLANAGLKEASFSLPPVYSVFENVYISTNRVTAITHGHMYKCKMRPASHHLPVL